MSRGLGSLLPSRQRSRYLRRAMKVLRRKPAFPMLGMKAEPILSSSRWESGRVVVNGLLVVVAEVLGETAQSDYGEVLGESALEVPDAAPDRIEGIHNFTLLNGWNAGVFFGTRSFPNISALGRFAVAGDGGVVTGVINMDAQDGQDIRNSPLCADYAEGSIYHRGHREHGGFFGSGSFGIWNGTAFNAKQARVSVLVHIF